MAEPAEVWNRIRRADEALKYGANRDRAVATETAARFLDEASLLVATLEDVGAREFFAAQIALRRADLEAVE